MAVEPKIFAKFDLSTLTQIALLPVDTVRFITAAFAGERARYAYAGSRKLFLSEQDRQLLLSSHQSDYSRLRIDPDRRMHWERLHGRLCDGKLENGKTAAPFAPGGDFPSIRFYNREEKRFEPVRPIVYYAHMPNTSDIRYTFGEDFIDRHNLFRKGYRDVCVDALNMLGSRYARLFFCYLSADLYEFNFSTVKLRQLLNVEDKYKKTSSIILILECVKKEFKEIGLDFNFICGTEKEWKAFKKSIDGQEERKDAGLFPSGDGENREEDKKEEDKKGKNKCRTRNFWFRVKGMDQYRVPKGVKSVISTDVIQNPQYREARTFLNVKLKMKDEYFMEDWDYIKRYINRWGLEGREGLYGFAAWKMEQMRTQKTPPTHPKRVLLSAIRNRVKELDAEGRGQPGLFKEPAPASPEAVDEYSDPETATRYLDKMSMDVAAKFNCRKDSS